MYRVFQPDSIYFEDLGGHYLKTTFRSKWRYLCISEVWAFEFHQPVFKKVTKTGLNSISRKGAKIQHKFSWFCQNTFFPKHQNKVILIIRLLNSRTWMPLKTSVVIFQVNDLCNLIDLTGPKCLYSPFFLKKHPDPDGLIITGTKMTKTGHFLWNGSSRT